MAFVVIATWTAREGEVQAVRAAIESLIEPSRAEPGCRMYEAQQSIDAEHVFVIYEQYTNRDAYEQHAASPHFQRYAVQDGIPRLASRTRVFGRTLEGTS